MKSKKNIKTFKFNTKKVLKKKEVKKTTFQGVGVDMLFGLIYFAKKFKNFDIPLKLKKEFGYKRGDYMNLGIRFDCSSKSNKQKLYYPINKTDFFDYIKNSKKRFLGIFLYLKWNCKSTSAHFNMIVFDKDKKTVERFEPYSSFNRQYEENVMNYFDESFESDITKQLAYNYIKPSKICPKIGFQQKEEDNLNLSFGTNRNDDPGGFCGAWSLYYLNMKLKYPNISTEKLLTKIYKYLDKDSNSMRNFIRNYSQFVVKEREKLLNKYFQADNKYLQNHIQTNIENKFSNMIER
jgi:hypothetical protein